MHRPQPLLQVTVVALNPVIQVPRASMLGLRKDCAERRWISMRLCPWLRALACCRFRRWLGGKRFLLQHCCVAARSTRPPPDRPDRPRGKCRSTSHSDASTFHRRAILRLRGGIRTCRGLEERQEALHPAVDRAPIHDEATLSEPCDEIGITEAVADVPAYG